MNVYIVTYDLNREIVRPNILGAIRKYNWAKLSESSYAIETHETPRDVFNALKAAIDANDTIYVIPLQKPYAGFGPAEVNRWLEEKLPWRY